MFLKLLSNITLGFTIVMLTANCVKPRPDIIQQGSRINDMLEVRTYHNLNCTLTTDKNPRADVDTLTAAEEVNSDHPLIRYNKVYNYQTNCPFLGDNIDEIEFRGQANTTYTIVFKVEVNNLVAYKKIDKKQISHFEVTYSTKAENYYLVPIGGFSISGFFNTEKKRNADNRETNVVMPSPVDRKNYKQASYFQMDIKNFEKFEISSEKVDVLPRKYFDGEWYFQRTVVRKRYGSNSSVGYGSSGGGDLGNNFIDGSRIEFIWGNKNIFGVSVNVDEKLKKQMEETGDRLNTVIPVSIPGELVSYKREQQGQGLGLSEQEIDTSVENGEYFKMTPVEIQTLQDAGQDMLTNIFASFEKKELKLIKIEEDYFEIVIEKGGLVNGELIRYSFLRAQNQSDYEPRPAFISDMKTFGYFMSTKHQIYDERTARLKDIEGRNFITRFNPKKDIVYHFSSATPQDQWVRDIGRETINLWQQAFKKAGLDINIRLDESRDQELGDIRYNLLNIITDDTGDNGGVGPSFKEASTGEIISAVANIYTAGDKYIFYNGLRAYVAEELGYQPDISKILGSTVDETESIHARLNYVYTNGMFNKNSDGKYFLLPTYQWKSPRTQKGFIYAPLVTDNEVKDLIVYNDLFEEKQISSVGGLLEELEHQSSDPFTTGPGRITSFHGKQKLLFLQSPHTARISQEIEDAQGRIYDKAMIDYAKKHCPAIDQFIVKLRNENRLPSTREENQVLAPCVRQLVQIQALGNLVHEVGHNLGLRHNFLGTADKKNFLPSGSYTTQFIDLDNPFSGEVGSSSCMDYVPWVSHSQVAPGAYDLAALRFGYKGLVEVKTSSSTQPKMVYVPRGKEIDKTFSSEGLKKKDYAYCTDLEARVLKTDPYCSVHDYGTNPVEMVKFAADRDLRGINRGLVRFDKTGLRTQSPRQSLNRMKEFYDEWRSKVAAHTGYKKSYLSGLTVEEYQDIVQELLNDPVDGPKNKQLLQARNIFVNTALELAFLPNKYCVVSDENDATYLLELSVLKEEVRLRANGGQVKSCQSSLIQDLLEGEGLTLSKEIGYYLEGGRYSLERRDLQEVLDYSGAQILRLLSFDFLTTRHTPSYFYSFEANFSPTAMDEPDVRQLVTTLLIDRVLSGVRLSDRKIDLDAFASPRLFTQEDVMMRLSTEAPPYLNFREELDLIVSFYGRLLRSFMVPGEERESDKRLAPYRVHVTNNPAIIRAQNAVDSMNYQSGLYMYVKESNRVAAELMKKYKELLTRKNSSTTVGQNFNNESLVQFKERFLKDSTKLLLPKDGPILAKDLMALYIRLVDTIAMLSQVKGGQAGAQLLTYAFMPEIQLIESGIVQNMLGSIMRDHGVILNQNLLGTLESKGVELTDPQLRKLKEIVFNTELPSQFAIGQEKMKALEQAMNSDLTEALKEVDLMVTEDQLAARFDQVISQLEQNHQENQDVGRDYLANEEEYEAQMNLLYELLKSGASI